MLLIPYIHASKNLYVTAATLWHGGLLTIPQTSISSDISLQARSVHPSHQTPNASYFRLVLWITLPQSPDTHPISFQARPMDYSTPVPRPPSHLISGSS